MRAERAKQRGGGGEGAQARRDEQLVQALPSCASLVAARTSRLTSFRLQHGQHRVQLPVSLVGTLSLVAGFEFRSNGAAL